MSPFRRTAIPAAVIVVAALSACQDAPMAPNDPGRVVVRTPGVSQSIRVRTFSGQRADSVINQLLGAWAAHGHPEYQEARATWHPRSRPSGADGTAPAAKAPASSSAVLDAAAGVKPTPTVVQHHQELYFGHYGNGFTVPSGINAWMQFVGDLGKIDLASLSFTGSGGSSYSSGAPITSGTGQLSNCFDVVLGQCGSVKEMEGALLLDDAPICDASGNGNVVYTALNVTSSFALGTPLVPPSTNVGDLGGSAVANGSLTGSAASCTSDDGNTTGSTVGGGDNQPPVWPDNPTPTDYPGSQPPTGGTSDFHCETTQWWQYGSLQGEETNCYPDN